MRRVAIEAPSRKASEGDGAADFQKLGFVVPNEVRYQYQVVTSGLIYVATAIGDIDGDGLQATYTLSNMVPRPVLTTPGVF